MVCAMLKVTTEVSLTTEFYYLNEQTEDSIIR